MTSKALRDFGNHVREARVRKGWTLETLAQTALNNPERKGYVSQIENGKRPLSALTIGNLARVLNLPESVTRPLLFAPEMEDEVTREDRNAEHLINIATQNPTTFQPAEALLIALAYQYAPGSEGDLVSASNGLRAALDTAAEMQRTARLPHNAADQVDAVLAELETLNAKGELDAGAATLATARAAARDRIAEETSGLMRILDSTVAQARLRNAPQDAADALVEKLLLDTPHDPFNALRMLQDEWYERGRDQGLAFDATVAIHLAEYSLTHAQTPDQRGAALNDLGIALSILGKREPSTARLDAAVQAYTAALQEFTRDRVPLEWARTQMNLGNALAILGIREPGTARLEAAVLAYTAALQEYTRDRVPLEWARAQMNLGNALATLGEREPGTARLDAAVQAYTAALQEFTRERVPLDWATTQVNLGTALRNLGQREPGTTRLDAAVLAYTAALQECTRERVPLDWARTQMNLGNALFTLGQREPGTARLEAAVLAYTAALQEYTRDRVPLDWATTQMNLGNALFTLGQREPGTARLDAAVQAYTAALKECTRDRVPLQWAMVLGNLANVEIAYFDKTANPSHLATACTHALAAREVFVAAQAEHYVQITDRQLAKIADRTP